MKSLVEEASSVAKAIEKAWNRAGNPQTFSVKVFETPETSFFGFTKKSAKVGIFFEEEAPQPTRKHANARENRSQQNRPAKGREGTQQPRTSDSQERAQASTPNNRQGRSQNTPPRQGQKPQQPRQEQQGRQEGQPSRNRGEQRSSRPHDQRQKSPDRSSEHQGFIAHPTHEHDVPTHEKYMHETYQERQEQFHQQAAPQPTHQERYDRELPRNGRDSRRDDSRGERRQQSRKPQRAQRHEFNENRDLVNVNGTSEFSPSASEPTHSAPEASAIPTPTLVPQKKVLKVSGRRYSAPVKSKDEE